MIKDQTQKVSENIFAIVLLIASAATIIYTIITVDSDNDQIYHKENIDFYFSKFLNDQNISKIHFSEDLDDYVILYVISDMSCHLCLNDINDYNNVFKNNSSIHFKGIIISLNSENYENGTRMFVLSGLKLDFIITSDNIINKYCDKNIIPNRAYFLHRSEDKLFYSSQISRNTLSIKTKTSIKNKIFKILAPDL